jgi:hypothetical protein
LLDEPVTRIAPKSDYLQKLDDDHAARQRAATAPQNVVALRARRTTTKG